MNVNVNVNKKNYIAPIVEVESEALACVSTPYYLRKEYSYELQILYAHS